MECKKCLSLLCEYKDRELGETACAEMKSHLENCSSCWAELKAMNGISDIMTFVKAPAAPAGFEDNVIKEIARPIRRFAFPPRGMPDFSFIYLPQLRLAALALLIAAGVFYAGKSGVQKEVYSDMLITDAELNEFDSEIMNIFYGEI